MCAARVLSDVFDKVTIIERDAYPSAPDFRPGVPQARHVHNLLARGLREFESFFPGFEARMRERGAVPVETGWDTATLWPHGSARRAHTGLWQLYASRYRSVFQVHASIEPAKWSYAGSEAPTRAFIFPGTAPCFVGIKACASSRPWSRELQALGHTVRLPPAYVKDGSTMTSLEGG